jgi:hypothetical protein
LANPLVTPWLARPERPGAQMLSGTHVPARGWLLGLLILGWVVRVTIFVRRRTKGDFSDVDTVATVQIALVLLLAACLVFSRGLAPLLKLMPKKAAGILLLYYVFGALSAVWSASPMYSLYRASEVIVLLVAVSLIMSYSQNAAAAERTMLAASLIVIVLQAYTQGGVQLVAWRSNSYPAMAAIVFCYCVGELLSRPTSQRRFLLIMAIVSAGFVVRGMSTASFIATICGVAVALKLSPNGRLVVILLLVIAVAVGGVIVGGHVRDVLLPGKPENYDVAGMSGRVQLWSDYADQIVQHPVLGSGFDMLSRVAGFATNSHNSAIAALGGTGLVGSSILLVWVALVAKEIFISLRTNLPGARGVAAGLTAAIVNSCTIAFLGEHFLTTTVVFGLLMAFHTLFVARTAANGARRAVGYCPIWGARGMRA